MFETGQGQIGVDFVRDDQNMVAFTDFEHAVQFVFGPDAAAWVVGAAQDEHFAIIGGFCLEILEIDFKTFVDKGKLVNEQFPVVMLGNEHERWVNRRLNQDIVAGLGKALHGEGYA